MKIIGLPVCCLLLIASTGQAQGNSDPFLEAVRKRAEKVKVIDMTFRMKEILPKNTQTPIAELLPSLEGKAPTKLTNDLILESTNRIVIQDSMTRYEGSHPLWHLGSGKPFPLEVLSVSNNRTARSFYPQGRGTDTQVSGTIKNSLNNEYLRRYYLIPIGIAYRGLDRNQTPYPAQLFKPTSVRLKIDKEDCLEYASLIGKDLRVSVLVNPALDYNVVRIQMNKQGAILSQTDISYVKNDVCEWVLKSWIDHLFAQGGKPQRRTEVTVTSCTINNPLPNEQFDIVFPSGTRVFNGEDNRYYRVSSAGALTLLSPSGEDVSPEVHLQGPWVQRHFYLLIIGCAGAIVLTIILVWRRGMRTRSVEASGKA